MALKRRRKEKTNLIVQICWQRKYKSASFYEFPPQCVDLNSLPHCRRVADAGRQERWRCWCCLLVSSLATWVLNRAFYKTGVTNIWFNHVYPLDSIMNQIFYFIRVTRSESGGTVGNPPWRTTSKSGKWCLLGRKAWWLRAPALKPQRPWFKTHSSSRLTSCVTWGSQ